MIYRYYNEQAVSKIFTQIPTKIVYLSNVKLAPQGDITKVIRGKDKNLKDRVVKILNTKIQILLEEERLKV